MGLAKRIFLFLVLNIAVVLTISLLLSIFNIRPYLSSHGLDTESLLIFCLIWGMGGALISLSLSRLVAKWMLGVKIIDENTTDPALYALLNKVHSLCRAAGLTHMPQVGIYNSPELNAFATGPTKNRSLVAVSSGLLNKMSAKELEGVLAHEITHIANGDMVTMTLIQGVVNAFVMFLARILAYAVSGLGNNQKNRSSSTLSFSVFTFLFEIVFMLLGSLVIAFFSRVREYRADKGGAALAGKDKMIAALQALQRSLPTHDPKAEVPAFQSMKISSSKPSRVVNLFATHPPLELRIKKLLET